jgi:hypothetical protein
VRRREGRSHRTGCLICLPGPGERRPRPGRSPITADRGGVAAKSCRRPCDASRQTKAAAAPQPPHPPMLTRRQGATVTPFERWRRWRLAWRRPAGREPAPYFGAVPSPLAFRVALGWAAGWPPPPSPRFVVEPKPSAPVALRFPAAAGRFPRSPPVRDLGMSGIKASFTRYCTRIGPSGGTSTVGPIPGYAETTLARRRETRGGGDEAHAAGQKANC